MRHKYYVIGRNSTNAAGVAYLKETYLDQTTADEYQYVDKIAFATRYATIDNAEFALEFFKIPPDIVFFIECIIEETGWRYFPK